MHFMLDCYGCPKDKLNDVALVFNFLDSFPEKIKMTKVSEPQVFKYNANSAGEWGVSGVVLIAESHISIHTFPDKEHVFIDIFSCKKFDTDLAKEEIMKVFAATDHDEKVLDHAFHFAKEKHDAKMDLVGSTAVLH